MSRKTVIGLLVILLVGLLLLREVNVNLESLENEIANKDQQIDKLESQKQDLSKYIKDLHLEQYKAKDELQNIQEELSESEKELENLRKRNTQTSSRGSGGVSQSRHKTQAKTDLGTFLATAYCDTVESQGQWVGQTATEFSLLGKSRTQAMCIAVDPKVIPLYSKVELTFSGEMAKYNGVYTAYDVGGDIKGKRIDLFMGGASSVPEANRFGRQDVQVRILK